MARNDPVSEGWWGRHLPVQPHAALLSGSPAIIALMLPAAGGHRSEHSGHGMSHTSTVGDTCARLAGTTLAKSERRALDRQGMRFAPHPAGALPLLCKEARVPGMSPHFELSLKVGSPFGETAEETWGMKKLLFV